MNEHEDKTVSFFIRKEKRHRYRYILANPKKRKQGLDRLNHCRDIEDKYAEWLPSNADILGILTKEGSPNNVYLIMEDPEFDGTTLPLAEALSVVSHGGWGTIVSCIPGRLAYYYDECGDRRAILRRKR